MDYHELFDRELARLTEKASGLFARIEAASASAKDAGMDDISDDLDDLVTNIHYRLVSEAEQNADYYSSEAYE